LPVTCTGRNCRSVCGLSVPPRTWRRQSHNSPRLTSCRRATSASRRGLLQLGHDPKLVLGSPPTPPFNTGNDLHPTTCLCPLSFAALVKPPLGSAARFNAARRRSPEGYVQLIASTHHRHRVPPSLVASMKVPMQKASRSPTPRWPLERNSLPSGCGWRDLNLKSEARQARNEASGRHEHPPNSSFRMFVVRGASR
jgi:hypothetical protein